ncbi:hypothetical protein [Bosea sp. NPDC055594]
MSHVNVDIKDRLEERKRLALLEAERKYWADTAYALQQELENIPKAIREWGYIEIDDLTLIAKPEEAGP